MTIIIFLIILSALILVHELGHFSVAKYFGIRVDEFGLGLPPKLVKLFHWRGTDFTLNWLPFGGFVKIFGESPLEVTPDTKPTDSLLAKNRGIQASVIVAGVVCNLLFAWALISTGFIAGMAAPVGLSLPLENVHTTITAVLPGSPASEAGLKSGDKVASVYSGSESSLLSPEELSVFIANASGPITFEVERQGDVRKVVVSPEEGLIAGRKAVGISMDEVGIAKLPLHKALWYGLVTTSELTLVTAKAIGLFIVGAISGGADLSSVTGPVGLVGIVGDVSELGLSYLLSFTAIISINLAIINLLPFPALDGGRLLFIIIEAFRRKPISPRVVNILNTASFAFLILIMILVTIQDFRNIL